ncbi:hypothetical protein DASC09_042160 [Saccharomycopsis crataegensis]|uniref:Zn(2)-C6 fungal-type domain-containing protein n=1 Tax=Saccharomycopsis crataegensis TaxID=43959 RepID=A0AAV5QQS3_9ASCO|nr:hypothetical protein DASC09_042160 [Saccharomycopsis crataegensis]
MSSQRLKLPSLSQPQPLAESGNHLPSLEEIIGPNYNRSFPQKNISDLAKNNTRISSSRSSITTSNYFPSSPKSSSHQSQDYYHNSFQQSPPGNLYKDPFCSRSRAISHDGLSSTAPLSPYNYHVSLPSLVSSLHHQSPFPHRSSISGMITTQHTSPPFSAGSSSSISSTLTGPPASAPSSSSSSSSSSFSSSSSAVTSSSGASLQNGFDSVHSSPGGAACFPSQPFSQPNAYHSSMTMQLPPASFHNGGGLVSGHHFQGGQMPISIEYSDPSKRKEIKRRTRTGCLTCRKRRIKCDERKPFCMNCEKSKKECMGYEKPKAANDGSKNKARNKQASKV